MWRAHIQHNDVIGLMVAAGVGLLVGAEREWRNRVRPSRDAAGIRTFALAALCGAVAVLMGGLTLLIVVTLIFGAFGLAAYMRGPDGADRGLTTEIALVLVTAVGGLSLREPQIAAGVGAVAAILLASRNQLHRFVESVLTPEEGRDALILAGAALVALPLLPNRVIGPFDALNSRSIGLVVVLVMGIGAAGHVATRLIGGRWGLPVSGLLSGFVSSTATVGAMGARARAAPEALPAAAAGAVLSTVATVLQMAGLLAAVSPSTLEVMIAPLGLAGAAALAYGAVVTFKALGADGEPGGARRAFSLGTAISLAVLFCVTTLIAAVLRARFGETGAIAAAAISGLVDTHAAAVSAAAPVAAGHAQPGDAVIPILAGFVTNTGSKIVMAVTGGGLRFAAIVVPGLILVAVAACAGVLLMHGLGG